MARKTLKERFLSKVDKRDSGCWLWTGAVGTAGYGHFAIDSHAVKAHRVAYELFVGEIELLDGVDSRGTCVMHTCDNPKCVNPEHLVLGTHSDNMADKMMKGRFVSRPLLGERHQNSKLKVDDIYLIRSLNYVGAGLQQIAEVFGVSRGTVHKVLNGSTWAHV